MSTQKSVEIEKEKLLLEVRDLQKRFSLSSSIVDTIKSTVTGASRPEIRAVDGVSFALAEEEVIGVIGESGCGKSTLLKLLMGLHDPSDGAILFYGEKTATPVPLSEFNKKEWKNYRRNVQIVFQDPFNSLDPKLTVRETLSEPLEIHDIEVGEQKIKNMLSQVELNPPEKYIDRVPENLSGGEKQRVSIARALMVEPDIILADEPTSMLDISTQASLLKLLRNLTDDFGVSIIYISHDLSTVSYVCDRVNVMYLGRIVESAPTEEIVNDPKHPYTQALINAIPLPDPEMKRARTQLDGAVGDASQLPTGCRFKDRCPDQFEACDKVPPDIAIEGDSNREVACHLYNENVKDI